MYIYIYIYICRERDREREREREREKERKRERVTDPNGERHVASATRCVALATRPRRTSDAPFPIGFCEYLALSLSLSLSSPMAPRVLMTSAKSNAPCNYYYSHSKATSKTSSLIICKNLSKPSKTYKNLNLACITIIHTPMWRMSAFMGGPPRAFGKSVVYITIL